MKRISLVAALVILTALVFFSSCGSATSTATRTTTSTYHPTYTATTTRTTATQPNPTIGFSVGGAKDIGNFRQNIRNNYLPLPTDVTYEGLFYDYFFDTGVPEETDKLFAPAYSYAVSRDPLSNQKEYYLSIGLNSGIHQEDFHRKILNLVIVLDSSGSMGEYYNQYYYDNTGNQVDAYANEDSNNLPNKIESAKSAVVSILDQLTDDDRLAVVEFNSSSSLVKRMGLVGNTNMDDVKNDVRRIRAGGSTDLSAGMNLATQQLNQYIEADSYEYENRIIVITDAQPNTGDYSGYGLENIVNSNAQNRIYTTFIGVGVDFNSGLIDMITKVRGANYYSVRSPREFRQRVVDEFEYMVTPMVFNVDMRFVSDGWKIDMVFGSPEADLATGRLMTINTLFPSKSEGGEVKGGLVLLKLRKTSLDSESPVYLRVTYEDRDGRTDMAEAAINLERLPPEYFDNSGIRKGIMLCRYAALLKNWMIDERRHLNYSGSWDACIDEDTGIVIPQEYGLSEWERQSVPLSISASYNRLINEFIPYFENEMYAIGDETLDQELQILEFLAEY
jgi:Ca-activated chloride channel family protein